MKRGCHRYWLSLLFIFSCGMDAYALPDYSGSIDIDVDGDEVSMEFRVENLGDSSTNAVFACYFFDLNGPPVDGQNVQDGCIDYEEPLGPGEFISVKETIFKEPGTYSAWMILDPIGLTAESNEENNLVGPVSYTVEEEEILFLPDLVVADVEVVVGTKLSLTAVVRNIGNLSSGSASFVDLYFKGGPDPDGFLEIPVLDAGESFELNFQLPLPEPGTYAAYLHVDPYDEILESDEDNITPDTFFKIVAPDAVLADLSADSLKVKKIGDEEIQITLEMTNAGPGDSGQFVWSLYLDPEGPLTSDMEAEATVASASIKAGESVTANLPNPIKIDPGVHELWVWLDPNGWVYEEKLENNWLGPIPFSLASAAAEADLFIEQFLPVVTATRQVMYSVKVTNLGTEAAGAFYVDVVFDSEEPPNLGMDPFPEGLAYFEEIGLAPGESKIYTLERELAPVGVYQSWAVVDLFSLVDEKNEANNLVGPIEVEVFETAVSPDLSIEFFKASVEGNRVLYFVECVNLGGVRAAESVAGLFKDREETDAPQYGDLADDIYKIPSLDAGERVEIGFLWEPAPDGEAQSWVLIDLENSVIESNEANNRAGPRLVFVDSSAEKCMNSRSIDEPCICGNETVFQGFCCEDSWQVISCDESVDGGNDESRDSGLGQDVVGSTDVIVLGNRGGGGSSGCQLSRF